MRSPFTRRAPARSAMPSMRPSTWAGTPESMRVGRRAHAFGPELPHEVVVAADAARGDDHGGRAQFELADHVAVATARRAPRHPGRAPRRARPTTAPASTNGRIRPVDGRWRDRELELAEAVDLRAVIGDVDGATVGDDAVADEVQLVGAGRQLAADDAGAGEGQRQRIRANARHRRSRINDRNGHDRWCR